MRKIKEVLRLKWAQGLSRRQVARSCGLSRPAVGCVRRNLPSSLALFGVAIGGPCRIRTYDPLIKSHARKLATILFTQ